MPVIGAACVQPRTIDRNGKPGKDISIRQIQPALTKVRRQITDQAGAIRCIICQDASFVGMLRADPATRRACRCTLSYRAIIPC